MPWPPPASRCAACRQNPPGWRWPRPAAARESGIGALQAEADALSRLLEAPAARLTHHGAQRLLRLDEVEALMASDALVADTARQALRSPMATVDLSRRPVLFALARQLAEAWPGDAPREALIAAVFRLRRPDETHRARLRVEAGRLRVALKGLAEVRASRRGYALALPPGCEAVTLAPPDESAHPELQALLADGQPWSSAALALALGASQRSVQRALETLAAAGQAQPLGQGARAAGPRRRRPDARRFCYSRRCRRRTSMAPFPSGDSPP